MMPTRRNNWLPGIFNNFFDDEWNSRSSISSPAVNIFETEEEYKIEIAAPGLTKDDFKVDLHEDNRLVVTMEKETENKDEDEKGTYLRHDFSYSSFQQSMILPDNVEHDRIHAHVIDGILRIVIPKIKEEEKPKVGRKIDVK